MQVRCDINVDEKSIIVFNHPNYHQVTVSILDAKGEGKSIAVDGPTLIKAIQNAMND